MTCKECGQVVLSSPALMNQCHSNTELSSHEGTRCQFNGGTGAIKLGIDVHQDFGVVVEQVDGANPEPPQRFQKEAFLCWAAKLARSGAEVHGVYEACGFGFALQRQLSALSIRCYVVCPQKLDEQNRRVKTDGLDVKALCLKLDRFVEGNRSALALVRVPSEEEEQKRAIHRQREQLVKVRKQLEAQGRSLMVNHGIEPVKNWWKRCNFAALPVPAWMKELLQNSQPILFAYQEKIAALTVQLQNAAAPKQPRGLGKMISVIIDREIGDWRRFNKSASDCQLHRALPWRILQREYATAKLCDLDWASAQVPLPSDRIDQIAAATAVACTDRSTSRWKQNQRVKRKRKRSRENLQPRSTNLMN